MRIIVSCRILVVTPPSKASVFDVKDGLDQGNNVGDDFVIMKTVIDKSDDDQQHW